jgi:hypothetical protein
LPAKRSRSISASWPVEQLARPQEGERALEVPVGEVGDVEAQQRAAGGRHPLRGPARLADLAQGGARRPPGAGQPGGPDPDVERDEQHDAEADGDEVLRGDVVGIAEPRAGRIRRDEGGDERDDGDHGPREGLAQARRRGRGQAGRGLVERPAGRDIEM